MRTFTLEDDSIVPGIPVQLYGRCWYVEGNVIRLNHDCLPEIVDNRIVTASLSKPHRPEGSYRPVYTLRREKSPNDTAILVLFKGNFFVEQGQEYPTAHCYVDQFHSDDCATIVRMTPGMELLLGDGRRRLVYPHGATSPVHYTWRQWELEKAQALTDPIAVQCVTLRQARVRRGFVQEFVPGIAVTSGTPLGSAITLGTTEHVERLALFDGGCQSVVKSAHVGIVAERVLREPEPRMGYHAQELRTRSVPLYGFSPTTESEGAAYLVLIESTRFRRHQTLCGDPTIIGWQDDSSYHGPTSLHDGSFAVILKEGDAIGYLTRDERYSLNPEYVLDVHDGQLRVTPYLEWRVADMNEQPERYLNGKYSRQATPRHIPPSWVGRQVSLHNVGSYELLGVEGDTLLLKTDWSTGQPPTVERRQASWVTYQGKTFRERPAAWRREQFLKADIRHAVFRSFTTSGKLADGSQLGQYIQPVAIVELGSDETTGEVICMYGAPIFKEGWGSHPWIVQTKWCDSYHEAEQLRAAFVSRLNADESVWGALRRRLGDEQDLSDRLVW